MALDEWTVVNGVIATMKADGAFTNLVGGRVYAGEHIPDAPDVPFVLCRVVNFEPVGGDDFYGDFRAALQIDINDTSPSRASDVLARMDAVLVIPHNRTSHIELTGGRIRQMLRTGAPRLGPFAREIDEKRLQQIASTWSLKVTESA